MLDFKKRSLNNATSSWISTLYFYIDVLFYTVVLTVLDVTRFVRACIFTRSASLNSVNVAIHTTPTFFAAFWRHMLFRRQRKGTPNQELSYSEGLELVRDFLQFAATHTVEELQTFTGKETPAANWIDKYIIEIPTESLESSADVLRTHIERDDPGFKDVGGAQWWTLRARPLYGEWLEMLSDVQKNQAMREAGQEPPQRIILYLHGGAHYFAGNGTHRYQIQRHARKLGAKAFSVSFRLSPQYPFPCSLQDALAAYLYLISPPSDTSMKDTPIHAHNIVLYGDSSGGALALSLLIVLRDAGIPMPTGCVLLSPWVDLTHSFPSVLTNAAGDYIPAHGFHYRPSLSWPPIRGDPMVFKSQESKEGKKPAELVIKEQIQLYCSNSMISHPMVSLVNQGSLGGLPPLSIIGGSAELLVDEIMYIAHKAASPSQYPPAPATLERYPHQAEILSSNKYPPTRVQLQMFDDCCHVATTLSFSTPAKYMYRSAANFAFWALKAAEIRLQRETQQGLAEESHRETHRDYATGDGRGHEVDPPPQDFTPPRYRKVPAGNADFSPSDSTKGRSRTSSMASGHLPWQGDTRHGSFYGSPPRKEPSSYNRNRVNSNASRHGMEGSHTSPLRKSFGREKLVDDSGYSTLTRNSSKEASLETSIGEVPIVASPGVDKDLFGNPASKPSKEHIHIADQPIEELRRMSIERTHTPSSAESNTTHEEDSAKSSESVRPRVNSSGSIVHSRPKPSRHESIVTDEEASAANEANRSSAEQWEEGSESSEESDRDPEDLEDAESASARGGSIREQEKHEARRMSLINLASFRREKEYSWLEDKIGSSSTNPSSQAGSSRPDSAMSETVPSPDGVEPVDPTNEEAHQKAETSSSVDPTQPAKQSGGSERRFVTVIGTLPAFDENCMIRERVSPDGIIRPMEAASAIAALQMPVERVGTVSPEGPVLRWLEKRRTWDAQYRRDLIHFRKLKMRDRRRAAKAGYLSRELQDENPPLSAVAGFYSEELAWEAVKGQDSSTAADGERESAGLGVLLWSKLSMKPDAQQEGKKKLDELAKRGNEKLRRLPSDGGDSIDTPAVERELQL